MPTILRSGPYRFGSSAKRVGEKPPLTAFKPFVSRLFWLLLGVKNLA
jgi:hypothetical protein